MDFKLRDYILNPLAILRHRRLLQESQYWSMEKRKSYIQEKLCILLNHAVRKVPYYKRTLAPYQSQFNQMIDRLDLNLLPILTKDMIREHYQELIAENSSQLRARIDRTSGTTGAPMMFLLDRQSHMYNFAAIWRMLNWIGYTFGNRYASIIPNMEKETKRQLIYDIRQNCLKFPLINMRKDKIRRYVTILKLFNPVFIKSYASSLALFAEWIQEAGIDNYRPKAVLSCAETLLDHQKKLITEVLKCPIFDFYGQNEHACLISTCEKGIYHVHEEYSFIEFIPEGNETSEDDQPAQMVATTFDNFAMPLIRYQTNDLAIPNSHSDRCTCGRTYKTISRIIGRVDDVIFTPEGLQVARLDNTFKDSPGILEAQFVQKQIDQVDIKLVRSTQFQQTDIENLLRRLHFRLGESIKINLNFVENIPLGKNGKKKFIISEIKRNTATSSDKISLRY